MVFKYEVTQKISRDFKGTLKKSSNFKARVRVPLSRVGNINARIERIKTLRIFGGI